MEENYEKYIIREPVKHSDLPDHETSSDLNYPVVMSEDLVPEAQIWIAYLFFNPMPKDLADSIQEVSRAKPHKHEYPEVYLVIGDSDAHTVEVRLGDEKFEVSSPAAVYIPEGITHSIMPLEAEPGKAVGLIPICLDGKYVTQDV